MKNSSAVLLWCHSGTATINAPERVIPVLAGDLVLAPKGAFITGFGMVIPISFPEMQLGGHLRRIHLGKQWNDRMIFEFSRSILGEQRLSPEIAKLFDDKAPVPGLPRALKAREVARRLIANPADNTSLKEWADFCHVSTRTLQRQFVAGTGYTFSEWRSCYRVHIASGLMSQDFSTADVAALVGFKATSSLVRAFQRHTGLNPSAFSSGDNSGTRIGQPPAIPATTTFARVDVDQALWIFKGTATVTTAGYCRFVAAGDTVTIPSNTATRLDVSAGSIALPIPIVHAHAQLSVDDVLRHAINMRGNIFRKIEREELITLEPEIDASRLHFVS
ncbi:helix-turn-helix domain-containing protein [Corynebacterium kutscheri]|uniref:DNA-binding domain-containing protein, AraC-type n=1 Tax=Corynebacterium kutscheri TaxID=35755 RepID=A0A0F6R2P8_9CORY|nr:helix-turn-helix transcriptional regulator [Corynebacterium kutscheri]AKE41783.1 DNA-binding domain-containing protein, AraC-type [Corynebacterium kutscheri]VEH10109.1 HTH-type transcriptional repressor of iron protein A [Corynebacterium kutscheri]